MRLAITGTSGVGKTFLETILHEKYNFEQLPKYTNRPQRPDEIEGKGIYFIKDGSETTIATNPEYFFHLEYMGFNYGWKKKDLEKQQNRDLTIAITLESMPRLLKLNLGFIPILLYIRPENTNLLMQRLKNQLRYTDLVGQDKVTADFTISKRIKAAINETNRNQYYIRLVNKIGMSFEIKDDQTIIDEVIPYIKKRMLEST